MLHEDGQITVQLALQKRPVIERERGREKESGVEGTEGFATIAEVVDVLVSVLKWDVQNGAFHMCTACQPVTHVVHTPLALLCVACQTQCRNLGPGTQSPQTDYMRGYVVD